MSKKLLLFQRAAKPNKNITQQTRFNLSHTHLVYFPKELSKFILHALKVILVHCELKLDDCQVFIA
jgi:hypothetical protein